MIEQLTGLISDLTGRKVLTYQSQIVFNPDRVIEIFVFDDTASDDLLEATAQGQIDGEPAGQVAEKDVGLDDPSSSGQDV